MNIVLVCIENFDPCILTNIKQLKKLGHKNIYVLTNEKLFRFFDQDIILINIDNLKDSYQFYNKTSLNKGFRNGFWTFTSLRFFYIYEFMKLYNIKDVIHLENDVLIYYNCDVLLDKCDKNFLYIPFDTETRNIASIMYIPTHHLFKNILDQYDFSMNDMQNFSNIRKYNLIENFPIFINTEHSFLTYNYPKFQCIFDAAAMGQYLGGIDPRNDSSNTVGFINETCLIKYNQYKFIWKDKRPFLIVNDKEIPIFNLHIHCKNLELFI